PRSLNSSSCRIQSSKCPQRVAANQRLRIRFDELFKHGHRRCAADVSRYHRCISQQTFPLRPRQRSLAEPLAEFFTGTQAQQLNEVYALPGTRRGLELRPVCLFGKPIERADVLTYVTAKNAFANRRPKFAWDVAFVLDREIRDASPRIQNVLIGESIRRAGGQAARARSATDFASDRVRGNRQLGQDLGEKEPGPAPRQQEIRVLTKEAETRSCCHRSFEERNGVDKTARS